MAKVTEARSQQLWDLCQHHAPTEDQIQHINEIRRATHEFLVAIDENVPDSASRTIAQQHALDAMMRSNQAIVLNGKSLR